MSVFIKKTKKGPFGVTFTAAEQKAIDLEVKRQLKEQTKAWDEAHSREFDAMILWRLHEKFGFGPKRLKEFYDGFDADVCTMIDHYMLDATEMPWFYTYKLKEYGVDLDAWQKEIAENLHQREDQITQGVEDKDQ